MLELSLTYGNSDNELLLGEADGRLASLTLQNFRRLENQPPPGRGDLKYDRWENTGESCKSFSFLSTWWMVGESFLGNPHSPEKRPKPPTKQPNPVTHSWEDFIGPRLRAPNHGKMAVRDS